jgi:glycerate kinase
VIEMAAASGLELLKLDERNPWITTTYGTGQLILHALDQGCTTILLGIGGSATNDCGMGMASALGVKFLDADGLSLGPGGGDVGKVKKIIMDGLDPRISQSVIRVACDVTNPLTGPDGASHVYGPQKGADSGMVESLDRNLVHLAGKIVEQLGEDIDRVPGAGAAGGLGAGLMAFLGAKLVKGFEMVADSVDLEEAILKSDLVITGEGRLDGQTRFGKTPFGVAQMSKKHGIPVIGIAGSVEEEARGLLDHGFDVIMPIQEKPVELSWAIENAEGLIERTGERIARLISLKL